MNLVLGIIGGVVGALVGWLIFAWLLGFGMYAMILPGALVGLGVGIGSRSFSVGLGVFAALAAIALGVFLEWKYLPFVADESLSYFLKNVLQINPIHLLMIVAGGVAGYWFGQGRESATYVSDSYPKNH